MMLPNPDDRPTASKSLKVFETLVSTLNSQDLKARIRHDEDGSSIWHNRDTMFDRVYQLTSYVFTAKHLLVAVILFSPLFLLRQS
jgi:hypothetical protein